MARASKPSPPKASPKPPPKASKATSKARPKASSGAPSKKVTGIARASGVKAKASDKAKAKPPVSKPRGKKPEPKKVPEPKKATAKKTEPAAKPVVEKIAPPPKPKKKAKPEVTARDIRKIKEKLLEQRAEYQREWTDLEEGSLLTSQSESSGEASFDEEYADAGSYTFEREKELSIGNNIRDLLDKVGHALIKIEAGTYGICDNCGNAIAKARVLALPHSSLCLSCKKLDERTR